MSAEERGVDRRHELAANGAGAVSGALGRRDFDYRKPVQISPPVKSPAEWFDPRSPMLPGRAEPRRSPAPAIAAPVCPGRTAYLIECRPRRARLRAGEAHRLMIRADSSLLRRDATLRFSFAGGAGGDCRARHYRLPLLEEGAVCHDAALRLKLPNLRCLIDMARLQRAAGGFAQAGAGGICRAAGLLIVRRIALRRQPIRAYAAAYRCARLQRAGVMCSQPVKSSHWLRGSSSRSRPIFRRCRLDVALRSFYARAWFQGLPPLVKIAWPAAHCGFKDESRNSADAVTPQIGAYRVEL